MITGEIRNQIDRIWDAFWSGGIANPLEVIEQLTFLLFIRRLDDLHTLEVNRSNRLGQPMERPVFPAGKDARGRAYEDYRWSRFKHFAPADMFVIVGEHVFPYLRPARLYESPFTALAPRGPEALFSEAELDELLKVLDTIRASATAA